MHVRSRQVLILSGLSIFIVVLSLFLGSNLLERIDSANIMTKPSPRQPVFGTEVYTEAFERVRKNYASLKTVDSEASVLIEIPSPNGLVSGTGQLLYQADENKYRLNTTLPQNLQDIGLMKDVEVLYDGSKFYFFDTESKITSFQKSEEVRVPNAVPNPLFLSVDYLSNDDDGCEGCKMRLQDINMPVRWPKRISSLVEVSSDTSNGVINSVVEMSGGTFNSAEYKFRVRLMGESPETLQPVYIARIASNGIPLTEVILNDLRRINGIEIKVPFVVEVATRQESGSPSLRATFTYSRLTFNQAPAVNRLSPAFTGQERVWDSDSKQFVP